MRLKTKNNLPTDIKTFLAKVKKMEQGEQLDLSSDEDLSLAIMNLVSMEEHFFFTYSKTGDEKYLDLLDEVRSMRKRALKRIIKDYEGEVWCISKHLLATSMRFMEVGTKALTKKDRAEAKEMFSNAYKLYSLFWGLNLGVVTAQPTQKRNSEEMVWLDESQPTQVKIQNSIMTKLGELVKKAVDCCRE